MIYMRRWIGVIEKDPSIIGAQRLGCTAAPLDLMYCCLLTAYPLYGVPLKHLYYSFVVPAS